MRRRRDEPCRFKHLRTLIGQAAGSNGGEIGTSRTLTSDYDAGGRRTKLTYPDGTFFTTGYDGAGRAGSILASGTTTVAHFSYDTLGRRQNALVSTAVTSLGYDPISRLNSLTQDLAATTSDLTATYGHNPASQIVSRVESNVAYRSTADSPARSYAVNGLNQYSNVGGAAYGYDANGNLTSIGTAQSYVYDAENRLVSASGTKSATLTYDPLGRLFQVTATSGTTRFLYDGDRQVAEYNATGTLLRRFVHGPGVDEPLLWYEGATLTTRRGLLANHQGSIIAVTNATGGMYRINGYDAYGVPNSNNLGRFQYTGQAWLAELGLYHYKARVYDPVLGRFLQTDPVGYDDDLGLYSYVGSDPVNATDPTGKFAAAAPAVLGAILIAGAACESSGACDEIRDSVREGIQRAEDKIDNVIEGAREAIDDLRDRVMPARDHQSNKRPSNLEKHEKGQERKIRDQGKEKADKRRKQWNSAPSRRAQERQKQRDDERKRRAEEKERRERRDRDR